MSTMTISAYLVLVPVKQAIYLLDASSHLCKGAHPSILPVPSVHLSVGISITFFYAKVAQMEK